MTEFWTKLKGLSWSQVQELLPGLSFLWPTMLWLLLLIPLLVAAYLFLLGRRKKAVVRYGNMALVKQAAGQTGWKRHIPPALMLAALALLLMTLARPVAMVSLPSNRATILLAMDVSGSMRAADIKPTRIEAAQSAAKQYIKDQPKDVVIGIVAFAGVALPVQSPTTDRAALNAAIDRFELQRGTAVGNGILVSLQTLFPQENFPISRFNSGDGGFGGGFGGGFSRFGGSGSCGRVGESGPMGRALGDRPGGGAQPPKKHVPVEPGSYKNGIVIVMTDGQTTTGCDPVEAARLASEYGVKVYTIGFGTKRGNAVSFGGWSMRTQLDEDSLKKIADLTKGKYFQASSADDLKQVYGNLTRQMVVETREMEVAPFFAALAAILMMAAAGLSVAWSGRVF